jgi:hypothetical protein
VISYERYAEAVGEAEATVRRRTFGGIVSVGISYTFFFP